MFLNFCDVFNRRQLGVAGVAYESRSIRYRLNSCGSLYSKNLLGHFGCVNALEIDRSGKWMASGGDDRRVLIWNTDKCLDCMDATNVSTAMEGEHDSNVFCLDFDVGSRRVFSGGNDEKILVHDIATAKFVNQYLLEEPVFGISCHPDNADIFVSACSDGQILMYDLRADEDQDQLKVAGSNHPFHAVKFNPREPRLIISANQTDGVRLWDVRNPCQFVLEYGMSRTKSRGAMSVSFNDNGTKILALGRRQSPVLYNLHSPIKLFEFDHPGYFNSCTMKSGCFGGVDDSLVLSGSDDFNLYAWKIPEEDPDRTAFVGESRGCVNRASLVLRGHRSIVNQVRYNPSRFLFASCGIEKIIRFWSPVNLPGGSGNLDKPSREEMRGREITSRETYQMLRLIDSADDNSTNSTAESPRMIAFFDSLVRRDLEEPSSSEDDDSSSLLSEVWSLTSDSDVEADASSEGLELLRREIDTQQASPEADNAIGNLIIQKRRQLAAKNRTTNHTRRITILEAEEKKRAIDKALRVIRLHSRDESSSDSSTIQADSDPEEDPATNVSDLTIQVPAALQSSDGFEDDPSVSEAIVISLRAEIEARETLIEQEAATSDKTSPYITNNTTPPSVTATGQINDENQQLSATSAATASAVNGVEKETPKFKNVSSHRRNYRKRSHEEDGL